MLLVLLDPMLMIPSSNILAVTDCIFRQSLSCLSCKECALVCWFIKYRCGVTVSTRHEADETDIFDVGKEWLLAGHWQGARFPLSSYHP